MNFFFACKRDILTKNRPQLRAHLHVGNVQEKIEVVYKYHLKGLCGLVYLNLTPDV